MGGAAVVTVERLRRSVLASVASEAEVERARARAEHDARIEEARERAAVILEDARRKHEAEVEAVIAERSARVQREARGLVLAAQAEAYALFAQDALEAVLALRGTQDYERLCSRLASDARALLGERVQLEIDPPAVGGVIGSVEGRLVDYSLPALVDRAIADLGTAVARVWT